MNEDHFPILEYEAPKAFFLGSVANIIQSHDERDLPVEGSTLYLMSYLKERQEPLSQEELNNLTAFHRSYGATNLLKGAVNEWVRRFPQDRQALWALAQTQKAAGQLDSAKATLAPYSLLIRTMASTWSWLLIWNCRYTCRSARI